jgi:acetylornithine/succinyldiaminopimelate/putrescine aminotransferase
MSKKYYCSKHGNIGDPNCPECWEKLRQLCKDKNALLIGDVENGLKE